MQLTLKGHVNIAIPRPYAVFQIFAQRSDMSSDDVLIRQHPSVRECQAQNPPSSSVILFVANGKSVGRTVDQCLVGFRLDRVRT